MKQQFKSIMELAQQLDSNSKAMADYVAPATSLVMNDDASLTVAGAFSEAPASDQGHRQVADYVQIPAQYYDRLREVDKPLLAANVNRWMGAKPVAERRMVRAMNGSVRAILSDRYQRIDNKEVAEVALNVLSDMKNVRVVSSAITESRLYIKVVSGDVVMPVPGSARVGDMVEAGVMIRNSETGQGSLSIVPFANFLVCLNGMVRDKSGMRQAHIGRRIDADIEGMLTDQTRRLEDEVALRKVRDVLANAFDAQSFRRFIDGLALTTQQVITGDVNAAVEALGPALGLQVGERQSVLRHLITGGDLSRYGLMNAVTRTAEDVASYDRATEIETLGFRLVELPAREWSAISNAKPLQLTAA